MAAPTVTAVSPTYGNAYGGDAVVITGTNLTGATAVLFGATSIATGFVVDSATQITVASSPVHIPGIVNVRATTADSTSAIATANEFEYVGLFSLAEARVFDRGQLASAATYTDAIITAAEVRIREQFERICGVAFFPTTVTDEYWDGDGSRVLLLPHGRLISVSACVLYNSDGTINETLDATDLTDIAVYPTGLIVRRTRGSFLCGYRNVKVTYKHGWPAVPTPIKEAALIVCVNSLVAGNISDRTTSFSDGNQTFSLATAGRNNQWFGLPLVDSVLQQYNETLPGIA